MVFTDSLHARMQVVLGVAAFATFIFQYIIPTSSSTLFPLTFQSTDDLRAWAHIFLAFAVATFLVKFIAPKTSSSISSYTYSCHAGIVALRQEVKGLRVKVEWF